MAEKERRAQAGTTKENRMTVSVEKLVDANEYHSEKWLAIVMDGANIVFRRVRETRDECVKLLIEAGYKP